MINLSFLVLSLWFRSPNIHVQDIPLCFWKIRATHWKIKTKNLSLHAHWYLTTPFVCYVPQKLIFEKPPPNVRKIVLATNMAEASITINDVVFVVDCGKAKETTYDALNNTPCLLPSWISQASARQVSYVLLFSYPWASRPDWIIKWQRTFLVSESLLQDFVNWNFFFHFLKGACVEACAP